MSNENKEKEEAGWRKQQEAHWKQKSREKLVMERDYLVARRNDAAKRTKEEKEDAAKRKFHDQQFLKQKAWEQRGARDEDRNR